MTQKGSKWYGLVPVIIQKVLIFCVVTLGLLVIAIPLAMFGPFGWILDFGVFILILQFFSYVRAGSGFSDPFGFKRTKIDNHNSQ
jgi:hypothetical protein